MIKEYYGHWCTNTVDKVDTFPEGHQLPKLTQEEIIIWKEQKWRDWISNNNGNDDDRKSAHQGGPGPAGFTATSTTK